MKRMLGLLSFGCLFFLLFSIITFAQTAKEMEAEQEYFSLKCAYCHLSDVPQCPWIMGKQC